MKKKDRKQLKRLMKELAKKEKKKNKKAKKPSLFPEYADWVHLNPESCSYETNNSDFYPVPDFAEFVQFRGNMADTLIKAYENIADSLIINDYVRKALIMLAKRIEEDEFTTLDVQPRHIESFDDGKIIMELRVVPMFGHDHGADYPANVIYDCETTDTTVAMSKGHGSIPCVIKINSIF